MSYHRQRVVKKTRGEDDLVEENEEAEMETERRMLMYLSAIYSDQIPPSEFTPKGTEQQGNPDPKMAVIQVKDL